MESSSDYTNYYEAVDEKNRDPHTYMTAGATVGACTSPEENTQNPDDTVNVANNRTRIELTYRVICLMFLGVVVLCAVFSTISAISVYYIITSRPMTLPKTNESEPCLYLPDINLRLKIVEHNIQAVQKTLQTVQEAILALQETVQCVSNYTDCYEIQRAGLSRGDGLYQIYPAGHSQHVSVFCDMTTDGGGWTVFQYRYNGSVDFYRNFSQYEKGFGQYPGEFWLGLKHMHMMTSSKNYELRIDVTASNGTKGYMKYREFNLTGPDSYTIYIGGYSGNTGDKMKMHDGSAFTTFDHDRDNGADFSDQNCAKSFHGAWWYYNCFDANLNGLYSPGEDSSSTMCLNGWSGFSRYQGLSSSQMAIRPT